MKQPNLPPSTQPARQNALSGHSLRHDMLQPAAIAMMMLETLKERNQDESLKIPLGLLEQALLDLAGLIGRLP